MVVTNDTLFEPARRTQFRETYKMKIHKSELNFTKHPDLSFSAESFEEKMQNTRHVAEICLFWIQALLSILPMKLSVVNIGFTTVLLVIFMPKAVTYYLVYPIFRLLFGTLYPAYASYKAVRTKNMKEYVKWMMYWIVFALFTAVETFTDVFFSFWFPFYYEIKVIIVIWMLSPATKGSSILYRRFVHPALLRKENEIDEALAKATEQGYSAVLQLGTKGVNYATTVLMQTAIKGGGGLVQQLKKSYSLSDLSNETEDENRNMTKSHDETDMQIEPRRRGRVGRRGYSPRRTQSNSNNRVEMYFSEVDVEVRQQPKSRESTTSLNNNIKSSEDISSGYSSGEALHIQRGLSQNDHSLVRTASVGGRTRGYAKQSRTVAKKTPEAEQLLASFSPDQVLSILSFLSQRNAYAGFVQTCPDIWDSQRMSQSSSAESLFSSSSSLNDSSLKTEIENVPKEIEKPNLDTDREEKTQIEDNPEVNEIKIEDPINFSEENKAEENKIEENKIEENKLEKINMEENKSEENKIEEMRAGKYHKKPAPKAPVLEDVEKTVKATLVIKSGTLTTFTKVSDEKVDVKKKSNLTKLLNIPKNIFHGTFHKEGENEGLRSRSRSPSVHSALDIDGATCLGHVLQNFEKRDENKISSFATLPRNKKPVKRKIP